LTGVWQAAGFAGMALLVLFGVRHIRDEEIPRVALLTAAFFVASLVHVPIGNVTSAHLLLNGLAGVVLGRRVALAILIGLFLQAALLQHGGFGTLGINGCIMTLPALMAWQLFRILQKTPGIRRPSVRTALVFTSCFLWSLSLIYSIALLAYNYDRSLSLLDLSAANIVTFRPLTIAAVSVFAGLVSWAERRMENAPEFPMGLLVGELTVLFTVFLNALVLVWGGREDWPFLVLVTIIPHLTVAVIEGAVLGFAVGFLARVKPELVGGTAEEATQCLGNVAP
jgi:cobalt/nickel transport system permease protein